MLPQAGDEIVLLAGLDQTCVGELFLEVGDGLVTREGDSDISLGKGGTRKKGKRTLSERGSLGPRTLVDLSASSTARRSDEGNCVSEVS
jgi:hypothetical protein